MGSSTLTQPQYEDLQFGLDSLGIVYEPNHYKFYVECPQCANERSTAGAKTLGIFKEPPFVHIQCFHTGQCQWNEPRTFKLGEESFKELKEKPASKNAEILWPVPDNAPAFDMPGAQLFDYRDVDGNLLGYVARIDVPG